jgi:ethylene receptor
MVFYIIFVILALFTLWNIMQIMQGTIWILPNSQGLVQGVSLLLKFQTGPSLERYLLAPKDYSNSQFGGLNILLAEDDGLNRIVTKKLLERLGCQVTTVSSGYECLGAISGSSGSSFKIIMLDIHMPDVDGFEVATRIRKFNGPNWPLIIALIANAEEQVNDRCMLAGMNGVIRKPILLHQIADELRTVLHRAGEKL